MNKKKRNEIKASSVVMCDINILANITLMGKYPPKYHISQNLTKITLNTWRWLIFVFQCILEGEFLYFAGKLVYLWNRSCFFSVRYNTSSYTWHFGTKLQTLCCMHYVQAGMSVRQSCGRSIHVKMRWNFTFIITKCMSFLLSVNSFRCTEMQFLCFGVM